MILLGFYECSEFRVQRYLCLALDERTLEKVTTADFVLPGQARNKPLSNMSTESRYRSHWIFRFFSVSPMYPPTTCSNSSSAS
jgi:hypothetical protein